MFNRTYHPPGSKRPLGLLAASVLVCLYGASAVAGPSGPVIAHGTVGFDASQPGRLNITNSPNAIINWQGFSIGQNEAVRFIQQTAKSAVLNRVVGQDPSSILGTLQSNGRVYLINPHGMIFGQGSVIDTAGFLASTLDISDSDFLKGNYVFTSHDAQGIENHGLIHAGKDGNIMLIAPDIKNDGVIQSEGGRITLAAGRELTISSLDAPEVSFKIQAASDKVLNLGQLLADGGGAVHVFAGTLTNSGEISANALHMDAEGNVVLEAQNTLTLQGQSQINASGQVGGNVRIESTSGQTLVSGNIDAKGEHGTGGNVRVLGRQVGVLDGARIDASGKSGGGTVLMGGDAYGANAALRNAQAAYLSPSAVVLANALTLGKGGKVVLWSDGATRFYGNIQAQGGTDGGDGGFIETSGHWLEATGSADATAARGRNGQWLLDPGDVSIDNSNAGSIIGGIFEALTTGTIGTQVINRTLDGGTDVTIQATSLAGSKGDISVGGSIAKAAGGDATLTLRADNSIIMNSGIAIGSTVGKLNVVFNADADASSSGAIDMVSGSSISTNGGNITMGGGADPLLNDAYGTTAHASGITLTGATLAAGAGNIRLRGNGFGGTPFSDGVHIDGGSITTTTGTIDARGWGGSSQNNSRGLNLTGGAQVSSSGGAINLQGESQGLAGSIKDGVLIAAGSQITNSGGGSITIDGTGRGADYAPGVSITDANTLIKTVDGDLDITGQSLSAGAGNYGVYTATATPTIKTTGTGNLSITGTGGAGGAGGYGINLSDALVQTHTGALTLTGTAGNGSDDNIGVTLSNSTLATTGGNLTIRGVGRGSGARNYGVNVLASSLSTQGGGNMTIIGTGSNGTGENVGIYLQDAVLQTSLGNGNIDLTGTAGDGTDSGSGIVISSDASPNLLETAGGNITLTGTGAGSGTENHGIYIFHASSGAGTGAPEINLSAGGSSALTLTGTSGSGATGSNVGVILEAPSTRLSTAGGDLTITGTSKGTFLADVSDYGILASKTTLSSGSGTLTLSGDSLTTEGLRVNLASNIGDANQTGRIVLQTRTARTDVEADSIALESTIAVQGKGDLLLQPLDAATSIGVAGGKGIFNVDADELTTLQPGFASITIGRSDGSGAITFGDGTGTGFTFADNLALRNPGTGSGGISFLEPLSVGTRDLELDSAGTVSQASSAALTANLLTLSGNAGAYDLNKAANDVVTLAGTTGTVNFNDSSDLTITNLSATGGDADVAAVGNLTQNGILTADHASMEAGGDLTFGSAAGINAAGSGDSVILAAGLGGVFTNNAGSGLISTPSTGRWLVYLDRPDSGHVFGDLDSGNTAVWNTLFTPQTSISQNGDRYVFAYQPTLTFTATDTLTKTYGEDASAKVAAGTPTVSGFDPGVAGAYLPDTAATAYSGTPVQTSTGSAINSGVTNSPYLIDVSLSGVSSPGGYALDPKSGGSLTVELYTLSLTGSRAYNGRTNVPTSVFGSIDGANGETLTLTGLGSITDKNAGNDKDVTLGTLALQDGSNGGFAANYTLSGGTHTLDITQAPLRISSEDVSKTYDGTTTVAGGKAIPVNGTQLFGTDNLSDGTFSFTNKNAGQGNKTVTVADVTLNDGNNGANYDISYVSNTSSTITPFAVSLSGNRVYDGTKNITAGAFTMEPLVGLEKLNLTGVGFVANKHVGANKLLQLGNLKLLDGGNGGLASNYTLTDAASVHGVEITPADLKLSVASLSKSYDGTTSTPNAEPIAVNGTQLFADDSLSGGTIAYSDKNAGNNKTVTVADVLVKDGNNGKNYNVSYIENTKSTITPFIVDLFGSRAYNGTKVVTADAFAMGPLVGTEKLNLSGEGFLANKHVGGNKPLLLGTLKLLDGDNGALAGNYTLNDTTAVHKVDITPAELKISIADLSKPYDGTTAAPNAEPTVVEGTRLFADDNLSGGTFAYTDKNAGLNNKKVTVADVRVNDGNDGNNYNVTFIENTTSTITPAALKLSSKDVTKTYDGTTVADGEAVPVKGTQLFGEDSVSGGTFAYVDKNVGLGDKIVTTANVLIDDGNGGNNYNVTYVDNTTSTIEPFVVNLSGSRTYNGTENMDAAAFSMGPLVGTETLGLSGVGLLADKHVGSNKSVTLNTLLLLDGDNGGQASNYNLTGGTHTATITAADLKLSIEDVSKTYDGTTSAEGTPK
ncbi:MAG: filamentous hemagglutinin N-terminal domain-containing protein, partial [Methylococcaceae bacterium]